MNSRTPFLLVIVCLAIGACADKVICPAYQSSFIYDKETLRKKFSYFENDTVPKVLTASKTKYLIAVPESYRKRYRKMQTIVMKPVYPVLEDSTSEHGFVVLPDTMPLGHPFGIGLDSAKQAPRDSTLTAEDSVYVITKDKEVRILRYNFPDSLKFDKETGRYVREKRPYYYVDQVGYNTEQENYLWFFRKELILPDVRLSKMKSAEKANPEKVKVKKKGFFQKLMFWKKGKKTKADSLKIAPVGNEIKNDSLAIDNFDAVPDSAKNSKLQPAPKKQGFLKSLFSKFKKKDKAAADPNKSPAKKEEDQGF